jgi:O-antigen/teichoic acid export membrane protein
MSDTVHSSLKTAAKGTALILFGTTISNLLWFAAKFFIIKHSTTEQLGIYSLAIGVVNLCALLASLGVHEGATKYVSSLLGEGKKTAAVAISKSSIQIGLLSGSVACAVLFLLSGILSRHFFYKPEIETPLKILSLYIPFNVLSLILVWILRGYGFIQARVYYMDIGIPFFFLLFLFASFNLAPSFTNVFYAYAFSSIAVLVSVGIYGYSKIKLNPLAVKGAAQHAELMKFSLSIIFLSVMLVVFAWTDTFILGRYATSSDVGIYNIAMLLATLLTFPFMAAGFVFMPIAGEMLAKEQQTELNRTYQILTKWVFSSTLPVFFILFLFPEMVISTLFGQRFLGAVMPLRILSSGFMIQTLLGPSVSLLMITGLSREIRNISVFGAFLNIVLNYLLVKRLGLGLAGAAVATMLSYSSISCINFTILYKKRGIHPVTPQYIKPIFGSALVGGICYGIAKMLPLYFWMLPLYLFFFIGGYLLYLIATRSIDSEDIYLIEGITKRLGIEIKGINKIIARLDH